MTKQNIVKYDNDINKISLSGLTKSELNVLFTIFSYIREKGTETQIISFDEFRKASNIKTKDKKAFFTEFDKTIKKIGSIPVTIQNKNDMHYFWIIEDVIYSQDSETITIKPGKWFVEYFNNLLGNYTIFELREITQLDSKYSKNLYRLLIQYKRTGWAHFEDFNELKYLLDVDPQKENKIFIRDVLNKAIKELEEKKCFENLTYKIIKENYKQGKPIKGIDFYFQARQKDAIDGQYVWDFNRTDENGNYILVEQKREPDKQKPKKTNNKTVENLKNNYNFDELEKELINSNKNNS